MLVLLVPSSKPVTELINCCSKRLQLPLRHKGAGITSIALRHPIAYFASIAACVAVDPALAEHVDGLARFAQDARTRVVALLGPTPTLSQPVLDVDILLKPSHFVDLLFENPQLRIQRLLTHAAQSAAANTLAETIRSRSGTTCGDHDLVASCSKDNSQFAFLAPLSDKFNRLLPQHFVPWARMFLQLPPLVRLGNAAPVEGFDYEMETCLGSHSQGEAARLDLYGSHDNSNCGPAAQGKHSGHTWLKWTVNRFARMVPGVRCEVEPQTHLVLNNQFTREQCRRLFPKAPSRSRIEQIRKLIDEMDQLQRLPPDDARTRRQRELSERINALDTASDSEKKKAVRLDARLQHEGDELLVDCTIIHSLSKAHARAEAKRTLERLDSTVLEVRDKPAAAIDTARRRKEQAYIPLIYVLKKQLLDGRRLKEPVFTPMAVTSFGELGPGCAVVQEWLAMRLKAHHTAAGSRPDGQEVAHLTRSFRRRFRTAIIMVAIRRLGALQRNSGLPDECAWGRVGSW